MSKYVDIVKVLNNTEYSVLHGWQSLPGGLRSDLDIAINPGHLEKLENLLADYRHAKLVQMLRHESSCYFFILVSRNGKGTEFLQIDAAKDYRRNGIVFFSAQELNRHRIKWKGFWIASPEVELAYLLVKKTLKGGPPEHQKRRLGQLVYELGKVKSNSISKKLFGAKTGQEVISWICRDEWRALEFNTHKLKRALITEKLKRDPLNPLRYWVGEIARISGRLFSPTGLFIAVLGPDGAGKSTFIDKVGEGMSGAFRSVATYHLRPHIFIKPRNDNPVIDPHGKSVHSMTYSILKLIYYGADYVLGYVFSLHPKLIRSTMVMFDRYYDDLLVDNARYRYGGPRWAVKLMRRFIPLPDLFLILDAPENVLLGRKQEVTREELTRQRKLYRKLALKLPNAFILDAAQKPEKIASDASDILTDYLHDRYMKRRDSWFKNNETDTLDWLHSVISADTEKSSLELLRRNQKPGREPGYLFKYLSLGDGRGYFFPYGNNGPTGLDIYNAQSMKARFVKSLLKKFYTSPIGSALMKSVTVTTNNGPEGFQKNNLLIFDYLKKILDKKELDFALSLGTPGIFRKPVIQISQSSGSILGYAKVGWNDLTNALVINEANTLQNFSQLSFDSFSLPVLLHKGWWNGRFVSLESSPGNKPMMAPKSLDRRYVTAVCELADLNTASVSLLESPFWKDLFSRMESVKNVYHAGILEREGFPAAETYFSGKSLTFHRSHGDFAPWNAYIVEEKLFLYDWESSRQDAPPGWDLFHFIFQASRLLEKREPDEICSMVLNDSYYEMTKQYWEKLGIPGEDLRGLFLLYALDRLSFALSTESADFREMNQLSRLVMSLTTKN